MNKPGYIVYKCRRCGELVKDAHAPDGIATLHHLLFKFPLPRSWFGVSINEEDVHHCKDGNLGVADLIGFEFDKDEKLTE